MSESIIGATGIPKSDTTSDVNLEYYSSKLMIIVLNSAYQAGTWKTVASFNQAARFILFNYHAGDGNSNLKYLSSGNQTGGAHNWGAGTRYMWNLLGTSLRIGNGESSGTLSNEVIFVCF